MHLRPSESLSCVPVFVQHHVEKIAQYARSNCKNRSGLLVVRPGQLTVPPNAHGAELRCEYFKGGDPCLFSIKVALGSALLPSLVPQRTG